MTIIVYIALLLLAAPALAQQAHPCGHGHQPPCPPPPPPPPVTLSITFAPAMPSIPNTTPIGTPIAHITVTVSNGSTFTGNLGFAAPYNSDNGVCAIAGHDIILGAKPSIGLQHCSITATQ